jgi:hypothetical protein
MSRGADANAVRAERPLENVVLLTHEGYGRVNFQNPSGCVDQAMVAYLSELITPPRDTVCRLISSPSIRTSASKAHAIRGMLRSRRGRQPPRVPSR